MASSATSSYAISPLIFGSTQSNLNNESIKEALRCLRVVGGWDALGNVARAAGAGHPSLASSFRSFALARHAAAHDATSDVSLPDLVTFGQVSLSTALAFDALVSRACRRLGEGDQVLLEGGDGAVEANEIEFAFVEERSGGAREMRHGSTSTLKNHASVESAMASAAQRPSNKGRVVVRLDSRGVPSAWHTTDLP